MATVRFPASTVANAAHPYGLELLCPEAGGKEAELSLTIAQHHGEPMEKPLTHTLRVTPNGEGVIAVDLAVGALAPGDYAGTLMLTHGGGTESWPVAFHRLAEPVAEPMPFGIYAVPLPPDDPELCKTRLREVRDAGITMICQHTGRGRFDAMVPALDEAAKLGIAFMPSINLPVKADDVPAEEHTRLSYDDGSAGKPHVCFRGATVRARSNEGFARELSEIRRHAGFRNKTYYGDDLFMHFRCEHATVALTCYCDACRAAFRNETGLEAPTTTEATRGVIPADHPWLVWNRFRCGSTYGGFIQGLEDTRRAMAPDVEMGMIHGFPFAPFAHVRAGIYSPLSMPVPAISSYAYPYLCSPRQDLIAHYEMGKMGNRDKPVWMLGVINSNWTNYPSWQVFQNFWNMLAAGYDFMALFAWHDFISAAEKGITTHIDECKRALADCGRAKDWLYPVAKRWKPVPARAAMLYSFTTECFDLAPEHRGHAHVEAVLTFYRLALKERVGMDILCEEEVTAETLDRYEAVCLHDVRTLPEPLKHELDAYAARGGTVYADQDLLDGYDATHKVVRIDGAIQAAPETLAAMLRDRLMPDITVDSDHITLRRLAAGKLEYLVLVNNFTDQYWGFKFEYWDKMVDKNYEHMTYVRDLPVETTLRFAEAGRWIGDLASGEVIGQTGAPLALALEPSWGRVLVLLPCPEVSLRVTGPVCVAQGETARFEVEAVSGGGLRVDGAFAVKVTVRMPDGSVSPRSGFLSLENGVASFTLPMGINETCGGWVLDFEGGFPRRTVRHELAVGAGEGTPHLLAPRGMTPGA